MSLEEEVLDWIAVVDVIDEAEFVSNLVGSHSW